MREILFRGKRVSDGQWVTGSYIRANMHWHKNGIHEDWISPAVFANGGYMNVAQRYAVKGDTVGQYTGLTDKNGKRIFEGDIVSRKLPNKEYRYLVGFSNGEFELQFNGRHELNLFIAHLTESELIGNIHDNPELLEGMK